jgi:radical SAM superfamily enzyme YgiQ (UPF0313 family)
MSQNQYRIAFVHAPDTVYVNQQNYGAHFMPVWAYTLASHIPDDGRFDLKLYDCRFEKIDNIEEAEVFLFSGINQDYINICSTLDSLKEKFPNSCFVIGGPICWSFDQAGVLDQLDAFDYIFIGDGEDSLVNLIESLLLGNKIDAVIRAPSRFDIKCAKEFYKPMVKDTFHRYYGAVIEVSRGCPFLCEFCDIRIMEDNNRPHNKKFKVIIDQLDYLSSLGIKQIFLACDNFIGDPKWADSLCDEIIEWQERTNYRPAFFTLLTINLYKYKSLMIKMRKAGFDMFFIGVESFSENSLLETAKVQNKAAQMVEVIREIQSYGFIVVAGLIFGFDSDDENTFQQTLDGIQESSLLSGDPSFLTALPGTPLYRRIKLSGRMRDFREFNGMGGYKYQTNIKYLQSEKVMINGFKKFVVGYTDGKYQYSRLLGYFELLKKGGNFVPRKGGSFGNLSLFMKMLIKNPQAILSLIQRLFLFSKNPTNIYWAFKGAFLAFRQPRYIGALGYFQFWFFTWTNALLKYKNTSYDEFDIESVREDFDIKSILPKEYRESADELIPKQKINAQLNATIKQLEILIENRS